ncbi:MAG: DUF3857 domain-containing protein [Tannerellaceae bacterium]|nr:DUF3857 domain-containing protein [Tannerellaceae bacterium]
MNGIRYFLIILIGILPDISDLNAANGQPVVKHTIEITNWKEALEYRVLRYTYPPLSENPSFRTATLYRANTDVTGLDITRAYRYKIPASGIYYGTEEIMLETGRLEPGDRIEYEIAFAEPKPKAIETFPVVPVNLVSNLQVICNHLSRHYTLHPDNSQKYRFTMELQPNISKRETGRYIHRNVLYDPAWQQLTIHKALVKDQQGKEIPLAETAILEVLPAGAVRSPDWSQLKEVVFCYEEIKQGDILVLDFSITSKPGYLPELDMYEQITQPFPVKEYIVQLTVPAVKPLFYRLTGTSFKEEKREDGTSLAITWRLNNLPASGTRQEESLLTVSTYPTTEKALETLYSRFAIAGDLQLLTLAEALTEASETEQEQVGSLYNYITNRIDTSCLGLPETAFRIRTADQVINSAYGTIAEKVNLLQGLLNALEIQAVPTPLFPDGRPDNSFGLSSVRGWSIQISSGRESISLPL